MKENERVHGLWIDIQSERQNVPEDLSRWLLLVGEFQWTDGKVLLKADVSRYRKSLRRLRPFGYTLRNKTSSVPIGPDYLGADYGLGLQWKSRCNEFIPVIPEWCFLVWVYLLNRQVDHSYRPNLLMNSNDKNNLKISLLGDQQPMLIYSIWKKSTHRRRGRWEQRGWRQHTSTWMRGNKAEWEFHWGNLKVCTQVIFNLVILIQESYGEWWWSNRLTEVRIEKPRHFRVGRRSIDSEHFDNKWPIEAYAKP